MEPRDRVTTRFIGDVHGCAVELEELIGLAGHRPGIDRLLLTGDAFSRGPDPLGVWHLIRSAGAEMVLGNHDVRLRQQLRVLEQGGEPAFRHADRHAMLEALRPEASPILRWLERCPLAIEEPAFTLVHAGIHPKLGLRRTPRALLYTIRLWPPREGLEGPRWHDAYRPPAGAPPVIFGHDAPGGLVVKRRAEGAPYAIGLDSGCVYGGSLSAWEMETDRFVEVPSRQPVSV